MSRALPAATPAASSMRMTVRTCSCRASAWAVAPPSSPAPMMQTVDTSQWSILVATTPNATTPKSQRHSESRELDAWKLGNDTSHELDHRKSCIHYGWLARDRIGHGARA